MIFTLKKFRLIGQRARIKKLFHLLIDLIPTLQSPADIETLPMYLEYLITLNAETTNFRFSDDELRRVAEFQRPMRGCLHARPGHLVFQRAGAAAAVAESRPPGSGVSPGVLPVFGGGGIRLRGIEGGLGVIDGLYCILLALLCLCELRGKIGEDVEVRLCVLEIGLGAGKPVGGNAGVGLCGIDGTLGIREGACGGVCLLLGGGEDGRLLDLIGCRRVMDASRRR